MGEWNNNVDVSWKKFDAIFDAQNLKTPSLRNSAPRTPQAPKKATKLRVHRGGLKPRKLIYEDEDFERTEERSNKAWEDSGIVLWAATSSALRLEDLDKENRPESEDVISNSQVDKSERGSLRNKLNQWIAKIRNSVKFK